MRTPTLLASVGQSAVTHRASTVGVHRGPVTARSIFQIPARHLLLVNS